MSRAAVAEWAEWPLKWTVVCLGRMVRWLQSRWRQSWLSRSPMVTLGVGGFFAGTQRVNAKGWAASSPIDVAYRPGTSVVTEGGRIGGSTTAAAEVISLHVLHNHVEHLEDFYLDEEGEEDEDDEAEDEDVAAQEELEGFDNTAEWADDPLDDPFDPLLGVMRLSDDDLGPGSWLDDDDDDPFENLSKSIGSDPYEH